MYYCQLNMEKPVNSLNSVDHIRPFLKEQTHLGLHSLPFNQRVLNLLFKF